MRSPGTWVAAALSVALLVRAAPVLAAPSAESARTIGRRVLDRMAQGRLRDKAGLCVISLDTGEVVAESGAATPLVPASVAKLATIASALDVLGPGHRFETRVEARGGFDAATGTLDGVLVVHGSGDPGLSKRERPGDPMYPLRALAQGVVARGVRRVTGAVVLSDAPFDRSFVHPGWSRSDLEHWYGAPVGGLSFNDACVTCLVRGGADSGDAARVETPSTSGPWPLEASVSTSGGRSSVGARFSGGRFKVEGEVPPRGDVTFEAPVPDPVAHFGGAFLAALSAEGVRVEGGVRLAAPGEDLRGGAPLASVSNPLAPELVVMGRRSQNFYASSIFKALGAVREGAGTWAAGERAVAAALSARGAFDEGCRIVDGSGLARDSRWTAGAVARLLLSFDRDLLRGPMLRDALAVPGDEDGTMRKRLRDPDARARVRVKTGTLAHAGVRGLAGYVDGRDGSRGYAFAILLNAVPADGDALDLMDDVVRELLQG